MKKIITLAVCLSMLLSAAAVPTSAFISESTAASVSGDANGDGVLNAKDSALIKSLTLGRDVDEYNIAGADVNGDGVVNTKDSYCIKYSIANGTSLAPGQAILLSASE